YTPAFRSRVVKASFESGLSIREVARQYGIHVSLLYRWRQECRRRSRRPEDGPLVPVRLAEPVAQEGQAPGQMEITFRDGSILRFGHDVPPERVERLIMLLRP
ncbi:IS66 family insertion sequence element accessory protein TnpA, partial [Komagataeibacter swingsii]